MQKVYFLSILCAVLISCNNREKRTQALDDLDKAQQQLVEIKSAITALEADLNKNQAEHEVAKDDIDQAKRFQLLRTEAEREQHIRMATEYRLSIEKNIDTIRDQIIQLNDSAKKTEIKILQLMEFLKN